MPESLPATTRKTARRSDPRTMMRFIQELSWLLNSYADLDFKALEKAVKPVSASPKPSKRSEKIPKNPNIRMLVGVLPGLFVDERLFPSNEDIAEFAASTLNVIIPRWQKKSKFELIGHIVCTANSLRDKELATLVAALEAVTGEDSVRLEMGNQRLLGASWNEVIQSLIRDPS